MKITLTLIALIFLSACMPGKMASSRYMPETYSRYIPRNHTIDSHYHQFYGNRPNPYGNFYQVPQSENPYINNSPNYHFPESR